MNAVRRASTVASQPCHGREARRIRGALFVSLRPGAGVTEGFVNGFTTRRYWAPTFGPLCDLIGAASAVTKTRSSCEASVTSVVGM